MERKLAAILAADLVGYSKRMEDDEAGTLSAVSHFINDLINPLVAEHKGRVVKLMGDGILAEFGSVVDTINCAVKWQEQVAEHAGGFQFRIGVHLGDVIVQNEDIFGNGVNIAARLENLAEPGGICVSEDTYRQARGKVDASFADLGEQRLKNIREPVRAYRIIRGNQTEDIAYAAVPSAPPDKPSIAVLPFDNMNNDLEQEYIADGITEEIITTLSKVPNLLVIARNSTFTYKGQSVDVKKVGIEQGVKYVLEGSIRKSGNRLRIAAELVDANTGHQIWADRYDRNIDDIFDLQDEIALKVVTETQAELMEGEMARFRGSGTRNLEAWSEQMRAVAATRAVTKESYADARRFAERAIGLDSNYSAPLCTLGFINTVEARHGFRGPRSDLIAEARECAAKALEIDPYNPEAHGVLGFADTLEGRHEKAIEQFRTALKINPNHADVTARMSIALTFNDYAEEAIMVAQKAMRLNPKYPGWYAGVYGFALRMAGRYDEAIDAFREYGNAVKGFGHVDLAIIYALKGELEIAKREARAVISHRPQFTITEWAKSQLYTNSDKLQLDQKALRQSGLPD